MVRKNALKPRFYSQSMILAVPYHAQSRSFAAEGACRPGQIVPALGHYGMATTVVRIEHAVDNFDGWKRAFENDPVGRQKSGVRRYRILRPNDDPNFVMIDLEFDNAKEAENFTSAMRNLGIVQKLRELCKTRNCGLSSW